MDHLNEVIAETRPDQVGWSIVSSTSIQIPLMLGRPGAAICTQCLTICCCGTPPYRSAGGRCHVPQKRAGAEIQRLLQLAEACADRRTPRRAIFTPRRLGLAEFRSGYRRAGRLSRQNNRPCCWNSFHRWARRRAAWLLDDVSEIRSTLPPWWANHAPYPPRRAETCLAFRFRH